MKKVTLSLLLFALIFAGEAVGQKAIIELTFSAVNNDQHIQMTSVKVWNLTRQCDTVLYYPDTVLTINYVGINEPDNGIQNRFTVFQNFPNPFTTSTSVEIYIPGEDRVDISVSDLMGREVAYYEDNLDAGMHSFRFIPGKEKVYYFTATWRSISKSIKMLNMSQNITTECRLAYSGEGNERHGYKSVTSFRNFIFYPGDELILIGHTGADESGIVSKPENSQTYTFQFATNIPCPGVPTVTYEGQTYNTIQIFSQCWLKENLNVGTMIPGDQNATNNGIIEKYCYNNEEDSCTIYGGLYHWDEMMQYETIPGIRGICPEGWHVPMDEEWQILEGSVDSQYAIEDSVWNTFNYFRGFDAGLNLKASYSWYEPGNGTDLYEFGILASGFLFGNNIFWNYSIYSSFWTSTEMDEILWSRTFGFNDDGISKDTGTGDIGLSVRCTKDN